MFIVHRYLLIPLFLALIASQSFNRSVSICMDQLGGCMDTSLAMQVDACPCSQHGDAESNTCSEDCPSCHLDHDGELFVYSGSTSLERMNSAPAYAPRLVKLLEPNPPVHTANVSATSAPPTALSVATIYSVRLL